MTERVVRTGAGWRLVFSMACAGPGLSAAAEPSEPTSQVVVTGERYDAQGQNAVSSNGALGSKTLLDTPYSITVVDAEDIAKRQATTIAQIFVNDPAVFSFATAGTVNWWGAQIRGLGVRNYFVDDVPLLLYWGGDFPLESVETVEALKGLTGFMYGFGAPGGVISYRTKRPTPEPVLSTEIGYRDASVFYAHVDAGGQVKDTGLGYRVNLGREEGTAYNQAGVDRSLASLALEYAFGPDLRWYATSNYEKSKLKGEPFQVYWSSYEDSVLPRADFDYRKLNIDNSFYQTETTAIATGLDWKFARDWSADFTYGYTRKLHHSNKMFVELLNEAGDYAGYAYSFAELDTNNFAQLKVQGEFNTGPVRHEIVAGASYMSYDSDFGLNDYHYDNDFNGNIYQDQAFRVTRDIDFGTDGSPFDERQSALFLSDTLHLGEQLQAILGVRQTRYRLLDSDGDPELDSGYRTTAVSPTVALIYKPAPWVSVYGSYVEAMEPGSRVGGEYANVGEILGATVSKQRELGVKLEHGGFGLAAAAFRIERANTVDRLVDGQRYLTQDGMTLYKGVEATASYRTKGNLRIGFGAIHLDASIHDVSPDNADLVGNRPAETAKWQLVSNVDYPVPGLPGLSLHGNVRYFGPAPVDDTNTLFIPGRTLANAGLQYDTRIAGRRVEFTLNVNNLFDRKYWGLSNFGEGRNGSLSARVYW